MQPKVLISGTGVAGLALAYWLDQAGFHTTLVELNPAFRRGGQAVDIRGVALEVMRAMGLLEQAQALRTHNRGMSLLDAQGAEIERTEERTFSAGRVDSDDIELFRDDLCELLMGALSERVERRYGDSIEALAEHGEQPLVNFASGRQQVFDLVVGADGIYSRTRKLWFDDEAAVVKSLNTVMALFSAPNQLGLDHWELMYRAQHRGYVVYPSHDQRELRVSVGYATGGVGLPRGDVAAQKAMVVQQCEGLGGELPGLLQAMQATEQFYYNELAQIRMPHWSKGRVVLAGDAAHCASPFSGQGTSLALVGAFVLGRELARHADAPAAAFAAYEQRMRPFVQLNQDMVDLTRQGPTPDEVLTRAKFGIVLDDLLRELA